MLNPVAMSIIRNVFADPRERARAIGLWGAVFGISIALGPVVGGALVDSVGWRAVFFVNVPIGLLAIALTPAFVPESRAARARRLDPFGQVLVIAALASLTYAIIEASAAGWTSPGILALFAFFLACFVTLVLYELRRREPLLEMRFFRSAPFSGASTIAMCAFAALGGFLFLNTLALMLTRLTPTTPTGYLLAAYFVFGLGAGLINPPITNTAVSGMPPSQAGVASAIASTSRQVGMTLGVAVIGAIAGGTISGAIPPSFAYATHAGWWIIAGLGVISLLVGLLTTTDWALGTARQTAERFHETTGRGRVSRHELAPG